MSLQETLFRGAERPPTGFVYALDKPCISFIRGKQRISQKTSHQLFMGISITRNRLGFDLKK